MEKIYYEMPYAKEFEAAVINCEKGKEYFEIILEKTAFYPEGGGQPSDTGSLGAVKVKKVHEKEGDIIHYTDGPLEIGAVVTGKIDWERRFLNMQQHSGEHIVSGLIHEAYGFDNVGFHMGADEMTIDINGVLTLEQLMEIEEAANRIVYENIPLTVTYPDREALKALPYRSKKELSGEVRIVEIPGADLCACCGTHVAFTGEIGVIKLLSMMNYKGGVRISMVCGLKALRDYEKKNRQARKLSRLLSAKPEKIEEAVERLLKDTSDLSFKLEKMMYRLMELKAAEYEESRKALIVFEEEFSPGQVRRYCELLLEEKKGQVAAVLSEKEGGGFHYCIGSRSEDMTTLLKSLNTVLSGRGGGSRLMVQGTFLSDEQLIREAFEKETVKLIGREE